ncbi:hypothetical protein KAR91_84555 [Candidatus Pacearchaeota archaeon]|nr:hypothetical protein [Candidatus Pacearchaeota archaeon]
MPAKTKRNLNDRIVFCVLCVIATYVVFDATGAISDHAEKQYEASERYFEDGQ